MALVGRASVIWFFLTLFLLFAVLRVDGTISWKWNFVLIPIWILDTLSIVYLIYLIVADIRATSRREQPYEFQVTKIRKFWLLVLYFLKVSFLLFLAAKLDGFLPHVSFVYVFIPLMALLLLLSVDCYGAAYNEVYHPHAD